MFVSPLILRNNLAAFSVHYLVTWNMSNPIPIPSQMRTTLLLVMLALMLRSNLAGHSSHTLVTWNMSNSMPIPSQLGTTRLLVMLALMFSNYLVAYYTHSLGTWNMSMPIPSQLVTIRLLVTPARPYHFRHSTPAPPTFHTRLYSTPAYILEPSTFYTAILVRRYLHISHQLPLDRSTVPGTTAGLSLC